MIKVSLDKLCRGGTEGHAFNPDLDFQQRPTPQPEDVQIASEICCRLVQWSELGGVAKPLAFLRKLIRVAQSDRTPSGDKVKDSPGFFLLISAMSGDVAFISRSYSEIALARGISKQAVEQDRARSISRIHDAGFVEVAAILKSLHLTNWSKGTKLLPLDENGNESEGAVPLKRRRGRPPKVVEDFGDDTDEMVADLQEDLAAPAAEADHDESESDD